MRHDDPPDELWTVLLMAALLAVILTAPAWRLLHPQRPAEHPRVTETDR